TAEATLNRLRIYPQPGGNHPLSGGQTGLLAREAGPALAATLAPRARVVLFNDGTTDAFEEKEVEAVEVEGDHVLVRWTQPVGTGFGASTAAFVFTRTFRLFGHNAPASFFQLIPASTPTGVTW